MPCADLRRSRSAGDYDRALREFSEASKLGEGNLQALTGRIKCKIMTGSFKEAEQELEFLKEMGQTVAASAELMYLGSLIAWQRSARSCVLCCVTRSGCCVAMATRTNQSRCSTKRLMST